MWILKFSQNRKVGNIERIDKKMKWLQIDKSLYYKNFLCAFFYLPFLVSSIKYNPTWLVHFFSSSTTGYSLTPSSLNKIASCF